MFSWFTRWLSLLVSLAMIMCNFSHWGINSMSAVSRETINYHNILIWRLRNDVSLITSSSCQLMLCIVSQKPIKTTLMEIAFYSWPYEAISIIKNAFSSSSLQLTSAETRAFTARLLLRSRRAACVNKSNSTEITIHYTAISLARSRSGESTKWRHDSLFPSNRLPLLFAIKLISIRSWN